METIRKKINLSDLKNRYINTKIVGGDREYMNKLYYYRDNELYMDNMTWDNMCVDLIIPKVKYNENILERDYLYSWVSVLFDMPNTPLKIPLKYLGDFLDSQSNGSFLLRYKNLLMYYHWVINKFIPSCSFYRVCNGRYKNVEYHFNDRIEEIGSQFIDKNIIFFNELPNIDEYFSSTTLNTIVCYSELTNEMEQRFGDVSILEEFIIFCNYLFNHGLHEEFSKMKRSVVGINNNNSLRGLSFSVPYTEIPLSLTKQISNIGMLSPYVETWVPKKKYYLGDIVYYNGNTYVLNRAIDYDIIYDEQNIINTLSKNSNKYNIIQSLNDIKNDIENGFIYFNNDITTDNFGKEYIYQNDGKYGLIQPYHAGEFNSLTNMVNFIEYESTTKGFWKRIENWDLSAMSKNGETYSGICESYISDYKRKKKSVDDGGNILPFIVHYIDVLDSGGTVSDRIIDDGNTELLYMVGVVNETTDADGNTITDGISSIKIFENSVSGVSLCDFYTPNVPILYSDISGYTNGNIIQFTYYKGMVINSNGVIIDNGIIYEEYYNYTLKVAKMGNTQNTGATYDVEFKSYDNHNIFFNYVDINFFYSALNITDNTDIELLTKNPIYTKVTVNKNSINKEEINYAYSYHDETLLGVVNRVDDIDVNISRGTSAAFERHNILGEIKTLQDLQNFRNNYFEI